MFIKIYYKYCLRIKRKFTKMQFILDKTTHIVYYFKREIEGGFMKYTTELKLNKPDYDDLVDIAVINENMDIIDENLANASKNIVEMTSRIEMLELRTKFMEEYTWEEIGYISDNDWGGNFFAIGDRKSIKLKGTMGTINLDETLYAYIIGVNHNVAYEGNGITFGTFKSDAVYGVDICFVDNASNVSDGTKKFTMNHSTSRVDGGWKSCDLRYDILGSVDVKNATSATATTATNPVADTLMSCLPSELRRSMKPITKYTDNSGGSEETMDISVTIDYLPLLAEYEAYGNRYCAATGEKECQKQYEYYAVGNSRIKYKHLDTGTAIAWVTRSPASLTGASYIRWSTFNSSGTPVYTMQSNTSIGISAIFKI